MEIIIDDKITIDTSKSFNEQTPEAQTYLYDIMNAKKGVTHFDEYNRPISEAWLISTGYNIVRSSVYISQEYDWHLLSQTLTFEEVSNE